MAKLRGPDFISLQVRNVSASRAFYTETMGLSVDPRFDTPDVVVFDNNSIPFAISAARVNLNDVPQPGLGITLWLDCDNVNALHDKLATAGITIITPPYDSPFGRAFTFADPDGYRITANENPWDRFPLGGRNRS